MKLQSLYEESFQRYGRVLSGLDTAPLLEAMKKIPLPEKGTAYRPSIPELEACGIFAPLRDGVFGGLPIEIGMCWGRNTKLNCLEYHKTSEVNIGAEAFILLLAKREDIRNWTLPTSLVEAFLAPAGTAVEIYATSLHYAPCQSSGDGFRVAVVLPRGTNTEKPETNLSDPEAAFMTACNKWLLAHPESPEATNGARIALIGPNPDTEEFGR